MKKTELRTIAEELVTFIMVEATRNRYGLVMTHFFWPTERVWKPAIIDFDDMGDYLPFVAWAGKIYKKKSWQKFVVDQMKRWRQFGEQQNGWYTTQLAASNAEKTNPYIISLYDYPDAILGFYELYLLTKNDQYQKKALKLLSKIDNVAKKHDGFIPNAIVRGLEWSLPWASANPAVAGVVAEHAYLFYDQTHKTWLKTMGDRLIMAWLKTALWKNEQLFEQGKNLYFPLSPYFQTKLMKENTNMAFAMLEAKSTFDSEIKIFVESLTEFQHSSGGFFGKFDQRGKKIVTDYFDKTQNFAVIDLLVSLASKNLVGKKQYLKMALDCAKFWIKCKHPKTNLIPDYIKKNGKALYSISKLDQSADLYSSFLRLYCITKKDKFLEEALLGAQVLKRTFGASSWWVRIVNSETGKAATDKEIPQKDRPAMRNLTKYIGGALRFYLSLQLVLEGNDINKNSQLKILSRDR